MARGEGRQRICEAAVRLFNEQGYDAVSLRQIAAEADTTIGNLSYHFKHKEDLIAAILEDLHAGFSDRLDRSLEGAALMDHLMGLIVANEENQRRYPFYFENLSQLMVEFPSLKGENDSFARDICAYYAWAFGRLAGAGWLEESTNAEVLAYALVEMQSSWVQASSPYHNELLPSLPLSKALATLLEAHIAAAHRDDLRAICAGLGIEL